MRHAEATPRLALDLARSPLLATVTPRSETRAAPSTTEPWMFAQRAIRGNTR